MNNTLQYSAYYYIDNIDCLLGLHDSIVALNSPYVERAGVNNRPSMLRLLLPRFL